MSTVPEPGVGEMLLRTIDRLAAERDALRARVAELEGARPVLEYVSRGRGYVDVEPYPDALARRVLGALTPAEPQGEPTDG